MAGVPVEPASPADPSGADRPLRQARLTSLRTHRRGGGGPPGAALGWSCAGWGLSSSGLSEHLLLISNFRPEVLQRMSVASPVPRPPFHHVHSRVSFSHPACNVCF